MIHSTGSVLLGIIEKMSLHFDEGAGSGKYTTDTLFRQFVQPKIDEVWSRVNMDLDNPVVLRFDVSILKDVRHYVLPPCIQEIMRVGILDTTTKELISEWLPRGEYHPAGVNWRIEHGQLTFEPKPATARTATIYYVPSGDVHAMYHDGTSGKGEVVAGQGQLQFQVTTTPTVGVFDHRENSYVGQVLRLRGGTGSKWEDHIIDAQSEDVLTMRTATAITEAVSDVPYEVVPAGFGSVAEAVAAAAAIEFGVTQNMSEKKHRHLTQEYGAALKTAIDRLAHIKGRFADHYERVTSDNVDMMVAPWR